MKWMRAVGAAFAALFVVILVGCGSTAPVVKPVKVEKLTLT